MREFFIFIFLSQLLNGTNMKIPLLFSTLIILFGYAPSTVYQTFIQLDKSRISFDAENSILECSMDDFGYTITFERDFYGPIRFGEFYNFEEINIGIVIGAEAEPYLQTYPVLSMEEAIRSNNTQTPIEKGKASAGVVFYYEASERMFVATKGSIKIELIDDYPAAVLQNVTFQQIDMDDYGEEVSIMKNGRSFVLSGTLACTDEN
jgi:hypothetical protein